MALTRQWSLVMMTCLLLCVQRGHLYCIIPSQEDPCVCEETCLTLSALTENTSNHIENNGTLSLKLQPGSHSLDSKLLATNLSSFTMYSDNVSLTRIMCTHSGSLLFAEVNIIEITGLEFDGCQRISVLDTSQFTLVDVTVTNGNPGSDTVLDLNRANRTSIRNATFIGTSITIGKRSHVTIENIHMSHSGSTALTVYDRNVT